MDKTQELQDVYNRLTELQTAYESQLDLLVQKMNYETEDFTIGEGRDLEEQVILCRAILNNLSYVDTGKKRQYI